MDSFALRGFRQSNKGSIAIPGEQLNKENAMKKTRESNIMADFKR